MSDEPWFAEKRFGYGAGMPITWQGWAVTVAMVGLAIVVVLVVGPDHPLLGGIAVLAVTLPFLPLIRARTRGGWKWRR